MAITLGIDVSHYQGPINWDAVAKTPYDFALCRMTIGRSTRDTLGHRNLSEMVGRVPISGAYGVVGTTEPVTDGAKFLLDEIAADVDPTKILVMLDAENFTDGTHPTIDQVDRYARQIRADLGRWPIAYVPGWWLTQHGYTAAGRGLANCPWAPSHYLAGPWTETKLLANKPTLKFGFRSLAWLQYTSSADVAGVGGRVDADVFYGTLNQLRAQLLGGQPEEDISIVDDATKTYIDAKFDALAGRLDRAVLKLGGVDNTIYSSNPDSPRPLPDMAKTVDLKDVLAAAEKSADPTAIATLVAGGLEIAGIQTDPAGVVTVTFGPKVA